MFNSCFFLGEFPLMDKVPPALYLSMMLMRENFQNSIMAESMNKSSTPVPKPIISCEIPGHACSVCGRFYKLKSSLRNHQKWECGKDPQFACGHCPYKAKQKMHMVRHMERMHRDLKNDLHSHVKKENSESMENMASFETSDETKTE